MLTRLTLLSAFLLVSCQSVDSEVVLTKDFYAQVSATTNGDRKTDVRITFLEDPNTLTTIELEGDDHLSVYGPLGDEQVMAQSEDMTSYAATFAVDAANSEFIVGLSRIVDVSAPDSRVTLPAPFVINTPEGDAYSRANNNVIIAWSESDVDEMDYRIDGTCIQSLEGSVTLDAEGMDPGGLTVTGTDIMLLPGDGVTESCLATLTLRRIRTGFVDANYGQGGVAQGYQTRAFSFTTTP